MPRIFQILNFGAPLRTPLYRIRGNFASSL